MYLSDLNLSWLMYLKFCSLQSWTAIVVIFIHIWSKYKRRHGITVLLYYSTSITVGAACVWSDYKRKTNRRGYKVAFHLSHIYDHNNMLQKIWISSWIRLCFHFFATLKRSTITHGSSEETASDRFDFSVSFKFSFALSSQRNPHTSLGTF